MCESYLEENWQSSLPTLYDSHLLCPLLHPPTPEMRISVKCPAHTTTPPQTCHVCGRIPLSSQAFNMPASLSPAPWNSGLSLIISKSEGGTPNTTPIWYQRAATELPSIFCISLTDSSDDTVSEIILMIIGRMKGSRLTYLDGFDSGGKVVWSE